MWQEGLGSWDFPDTLLSTHKKLEFRVIDFLAGRIT